VRIRGAILSPGNTWIRSATRNDPPCTATRLKQAAFGGDLAMGQCRDYRLYKRRPSA
jgi:hypothetical protein